MRTDPDIAAVASLIGDPSRARILAALLGAHPISATALAHHAGVSLQTTSSHLSKLVLGGLLTMEIRGRQHFYDLASPRVIHLLEALAAIAPAAPSYSPRAASDALLLRKARTCYDHFAGALGVAMTDAYLARGLLRARRGELLVTRKGEAQFQRVGVRLGDLRDGRRPLTRPCLDWSERRPHLAGALGASLTARAFDLGWVVRVRASRAVRVTPRGTSALMDWLGVDA